MFYTARNYNKTQEIHTTENLITSVYKMLYSYSMVFIFKSLVSNKSKRSNQKNPEEKNLFWKICDAARNYYRYREIHTIENPITPVYKMLYFH